MKSPTEKTYAEWQKHYGLAEDYEMTAEEEGKMFDEFTTALIQTFQSLQVPFWNMSRYEDGVLVKRLM